MRVALLSSTQFGYTCLTEGILGTPGVELVGIVTTPSIIRGAGRQSVMPIVTSADFADIALKSGCSLLSIDGLEQMRRLQEVLREWAPDLVMVLGWYQIIPKAVLQLPRYGCVAAHASLLPKYRGMAPITWAIINGETETGVTLFYLDSGVDTGDIIAQDAFEITYDDTCATVYAKATRSTIAMLREYLPQIAGEKAPRKKQDHARATSFPRRHPEDGRISWEWSAERIYNFVRGQTRPYPGAFTMISGRKLTVWRAKVGGDVRMLNVPAGTIVHASGGVAVATGHRLIRLLDVQWDGNYEPGDPERLLARVAEQFQEVG